MKIQTDMIIYFIKLFTINIYCYYCFNKILKQCDNNRRKIYIVLILDFIITFFCTCIEFSINPFLLMTILGLIYGIFIGIITKNKIGYSIIITIISYAICLICLVLSTIITYIPYKISNIDNYYINLITILLIQFMLIYYIFKIKRFKNGIIFLTEKLNNDYFDMIMLNASISIILIVSVISTMLYSIEEIRKNLLISFIILGFILFILIQKNFTMYYKQKLLKDTLEQYKKEIEEKNNEIENLKKEKYNISKITHEFYNRQKALELAVKDDEIKNRIHNLTEEYSNEISIIKTLDKLPKTEIPEIDDMFNYMQKESLSKNIKFNLKLEGDIHYLINNIIAKNKLETLIGDHITDAINAVNNSKNDNKEILVILGIKESKYELSILDTGIEFEIETFKKLGIERITTRKDKGGSGIGFMTTFKTMKETGASLIIEEYDKTNFYTKSVNIRFDGKNEYIIKSYRAKELKNKIKDNRIIIREN